MTICAHNERLTLKNEKIGSFASSGARVVGKSG